MMNTKSYSFVVSDNNPSIEVKTLVVHLQLYPILSFIHCLTNCLYLCSIGYPVVTLGFGFKSYVSYKMRLRKQKEVQKENEFYMQLLQQALPPEQQMLQRQEREAEEGEVPNQCV